MNKIPFKDRRVKKIDDYTFTVKCDGCGEIYLWPEDFVAVDGKMVCGNCCQKYGVTI